MTRTLSVLAVALLATLALSPSASAAGDVVLPETIPPPCGGVSIDGIQECVNRVLDSAQGIVPCMENVSVNDLQWCLNWGIDYGQYWAEWTIAAAQRALDDVCDVVCAALT